MAGRAGAELAVTRCCLDFKSAVTCYPLPPPQLGNLPPTPLPPGGRQDCKVFLMLRANSPMASRSQDALTVPMGEQTLRIGPQRPEARHQGVGRPTLLQKGVIESSLLASILCLCWDTFLSLKWRYPLGRTT